MSRDVKVVATQDADIAGLLESILKELIKMNLYLWIMTDTEVASEDVEA